nr:hypothetical protein [Tanacetum cinerariifolium]
MMYKMQKSDSNEMMNAKQDCFELDRLAKTGNVARFCRFLLQKGTGQCNFGVDAAMELKEKHQVFTAASEDISATRQKLMLLVLAVK